MVCNFINTQNQPYILFVHWDDNVDIKKSIITRLPISVHSIGELYVRLNIIFGVILKKKKVNGWQKSK